MYTAVKYCYLCIKNNMLLIIQYYVYFLKKKVKIKTIYLRTLHFNVISQKITTHLHSKFVDLWKFIWYQKLRSFLCPILLVYVRQGICKMMHDNRHQNEMELLIRFWLTRFPINYHSMRRSFLRLFR